MPLDADTVARETKKGYLRALIPESTGNDTADLVDAGGGAGETRAYRTVGLSPAEKLEIERWSNEAACLLRDGVRLRTAWDMANRPLEDGEPELPPTVLSEESRRDSEIARVEQTGAEATKEEATMVDGSVTERIREALLSEPGMLSRDLAKVTGQSTKAAVDSALTSLKKRGLVRAEGKKPSRFFWANGAAPASKPRPTRKPSVRPAKRDAPAPIADSGWLTLARAERDRLASKLAKLDTMLEEFGG